MSDDEMDGDEETVGGNVGRFDGWRGWFDDQVSWLSSSVLHAVALMVLALIPMLPRDEAFIATVESTIQPPEKNIDVVPVPEINAGSAGLPDAIPDLPLPSMRENLVTELLDLEPVEKNWERVTSRSRENQLHTTALRRDGRVVRTSVAATGRRDGTETDRRRAGRRTRSPGLAKVRKRR
jgi:hypothetical protein